MRKLFNRDKPKLTKVTPAPRDVPPPDLTSADSSEQEFQAPQPHHPHFQGLQPLHHLRLIPPSLDAHHPTPPPEEDNWQLLPSDPTSNSDSAKLLPLTSSRSSSLASLPPGASPPLPNPVIPTRNPPPFAGTPPLRSPHNKDTREREKDRRSAPTAVSILNALNPQFSPPPPPNLDVPRPVRDDDTVVYAPSEGSIREEKKERGGFWSWATTGDREGHRREARDKEDGQQDLMRMIGYLTATSSEDWTVVLDVCERASATEANAKEAAKALRREFKYGDAPQQLSAARLWAIMLRNSSELFVHQCAKNKFLDTLEDVLSSQRTSPVVRERLLDVLAAAAYASSGAPQKNETGFRLLWRKVKPAGKPDEGVPFDYDDAMFNPPSPRRSTVTPLPAGYQPPMHPQSLQTTQTAPALNAQPLAPPPPPPQQPQSQPLQPQSQTPQQPNRAKREAPNHGQLQRVIPPEEDMRRLFQECRIANGNSQLLNDALAFASPEDLREKDIIKEWYTKCLSSRDLIAAQIPWATAGADRSRATREAHLQVQQQQQQQRTTKRPNGLGAPNLLSKPHRNKGSGEESPVELAPTPEEQLLGALLEANEALTSVLRVHEEIERIGIEREAVERSRQETRLDRSKNVIDERGYVHSLDLPSTGGSSSRSASPSPSPSPQPLHFSIPAALQPHVGQPHPLPPIPVQYQPNYGAPQQSLALPPPAPHGPRSPGLVMLRPHTPSPERGGFGRSSVLGTVPNPPLALSEAPNGGVSKPTHPPLGIVVPPVDADGQEYEEIRTPIRPSAKALGKRRVVETEEADPEAFNPDDIFYERTDAREVRNTAQDDSGMSDSDSESPHRGWPQQQAVHYVYDAVAERTQELLQQMSLVNGVH